MSLSSENVRVNCSMKMSGLAMHAGVRDCAARSRPARRAWKLGVPVGVGAPECGVGNAKKWSFAGFPIAPPGGPGALGGSPAAAARGAARAEDKVRLARGGTGEHAPVVQDNEAAIEQFPQLDVLARPAAPAGAGR